MACHRFSAPHSNKNHRLQTLWGRAPFFFPCSCHFQFKNFSNQKSQSAGHLLTAAKRQDHLKLPSPAFIPRAILSSSSVLNRNRRDTRKTLVRSHLCSKHRLLCFASRPCQGSWVKISHLTSISSHLSSSPPPDQRPWSRREVVTAQSSLPQGLSPPSLQHMGKKDPRWQRCFRGLQPSPAAHLDGTARCYWGKTYDPTRCALTVQASACSFPHLNKMKIIKAIESFLISHEALEKGFKLMQLPSLVRLKNWDYFLKYLWRIH